MVKEKWTNTPGDTVELAGFSNGRITNSHKNLAKMLKYGVKSDNQMCSTFYKHFMAVEYHPKNMEQEIRDKGEIKTHDFYQKYYSEPEIWYIMDALVSLLMSFKQGGYHHGDIQPKNIFIDSHGYIKMCDNSLINYGRTGYHKMIFEPGYQAALSPQLVKAFDAKKITPDHDPIKSDIYSIGITCLCAADNTTLSHYYNFATGSIIHHNVKSTLEHMSQLGFSNQLISTIQSFLDENEDRRASLDEIHQFLANYQDAIRKGQMSFNTPGVQQAPQANQRPFDVSTIPGNMSQMHRPAPAGPQGGQTRPGPSNQPGGFQGQGAYVPPNQANVVQGRYN
jgi:serine/threonine protein kinase